MATKSISRSREKSAPAKPKTKSDAYVGMLALALIAQIAGGVFLWLDYSSYPDKKPTMPPDRPPVTGAKQPDPALAPAPAAVPAPAENPAPDKPKM